MKTKTLKKNKVNVITMGCSKNLYDSEVMMAQLKANKFEVEHESKQGDSSIVIINTCGFIENAKEESINTILDFVDAKKDGLARRRDTRCRCLLRDKRITKYFKDLKCRL